MVWPCWILQNIWFENDFWVALNWQQHDGQVGWIFALNSQDDAILDIDQKCLSDFRNFGQRVSILQGATPKVRPFIVEIENDAIHEVKDMASIAGVENEDPYAIFLTQAW